ncbi:MAG: anthranilate synthase component I family protein, partial [Flavobacteriales bacterium]
ENARTFIAFDPLFTVKKVRDGLEYSDRESNKLIQEIGSNIHFRLHELFHSLIVVSGSPGECSGFFGYTSFESANYFDPYQEEMISNNEIPEMMYRFFRFVICIDHFQNHAYLIEHRPDQDTSQIDDVLKLIERPNGCCHDFFLQGEEFSYLSDNDFIQLVEKAKAHCYRGDVFQLVLSRRFTREVGGDDFAFYRSLRSVSPSPYLFYFDMGDFRLMGSSPEAQLLVKNGKAEIHPIAGTFRRTGNDEKDRALATELLRDEKETAEHIMLVDLARNDLSKNGTQVKVDQLMEAQYYSHVIHLVSRVSAVVDDNSNAVQLFADTFPAGTLSGAPKHRALQLIARYEPHQRGFYGGAIGFFGLDGSVKHAIMIRSVLSKDGKFHYQAGAGVVAASDPKNELQEVNNKLSAIRSALKQACSIPESIEL